MQNFELFHIEFWRPFARFGLTHDFFNISQETIINTWIVLGVILVLSILARLALAKPDSFPGIVVLSLVRQIVSIPKQAIETFTIGNGYFIVSLFLFILFCNIIVLFPGCEEPTKDLSTTVGLAILSFFYTQKEAIRVHGLLHYLNHFFKTPFPITPISYSLLGLPWALCKILLNCVIGIASFPLEAMSKFASIISLSFRLFGNIFGGAIIALLWKKALNAYIIMQVFGLFGMNLLIALFFGLFEGFIQAFVFATVSATHIGIGTGSE